MPRSAHATRNTENALFIWISRLDSGLRWGQLFAYLDWLFACHQLNLCSGQTVHAGACNSISKTRSQDKGMEPRTDSYLAEEKCGQRRCAAAAKISGDSTHTQKEKKKKPTTAMEMGRYQATNGLFYCVILVCFAARQMLRHEDPSFIASKIHCNHVQLRHETRIECVCVCAWKWHSNEPYTYSRPCSTPSRGCHNSQRQSPALALIHVHDTTCHLFVAQPPSKNAHEDTAGNWISWITTTKARCFVLVSQPTRQPRIHLAMQTSPMQIRRGYV